MATVPCKIQYSHVLQILRDTKQTQEKETSERFKAPIFLVAVLATDNVGNPMQFRRESQP